MKRKRKKTAQVQAGTLRIGGDAPVSIQSMATVPIEKTDKLIQQINDLARAGAELVRIALRSVDAAKYLPRVIEASPVPLSADIHFDHKIALAAIDAGIHKVRINPGNIGSEKGVKEVIKAAQERSIPIRIGVNGGSLDREKYPEVTPENMAVSAMEHVQILEDNNFHDIVVSIKSSDISHTIDANKIFAEKRDYPLHIGLTEAGYGEACTVRSAVALGNLLMAGIGDTIRVSMTGDPLHEIPVARRILESVGERTARIQLISCPTCGRTDPSLNILETAQRVETELMARFEKRLTKMDKSITIAVMGCEVNGPGEARDADAGIAGIRGGKLLLFAKGEKLKSISSDEAVSALAEEVEKLLL